MLYIVGVGPGDKELLTLKAVKILQRADVVAYGDLVPEEVVEEFAPQAERVKIGHRHKDHDEVVARLLEVAREKNVVLLKNGDPTVFGRAHQICRMSQDTSKLDCLTTAVAVAEVEKPIGLMGLLAALRDPDVQRGLGYLVSLLKQLGKCMPRKPRAPISSTACRWIRSPRASSRRKRSWRRWRSVWR